MWFAMWAGNGLMADYLSKKISWVEYPIKRLTVGIISTVLFTSLVAFGLLKSWEYSRNFKFSSYSEFIIISLIITFLISFFLHGREFLLRWREAAVEAERYQKASVQATYESLKNQVNPHFLFNSLNALTNLVYENQDTAVKFIKQLSEVYRYVLDTRDRELVSKEEELRFLNSYLFMQRIRFGENFHVTVNLDGVQTDFPPLVLQMLIENAIKHNIIASSNPLRITLYSDSNFVIVENNLQPKQILDEESAGVGLENIDKRYQFLTGRSIDVIQTDTSFKVCLPIITPGT